MSKWAPKTLDLDFLIDTVDKWLEKAARLEAESLKTADPETRDNLRRGVNMAFRRACSLDGDPLDEDVLT